MEAICLGPLSNPKKIFGQICCGRWPAKGEYPRVETPFTPDEPDEPDVVDAGDVVEGLGVVGVDRVECVG